MVAAHTQEMKLLSDLAGLYTGKPILVIGGGPSAAHDLQRIPRDLPACVISANGHGFKQTRFKVDYVVSVDFFFGSTGIPMREYLAKATGKELVHINRWSWADYRVPEFTFNGDSGQTAVAVAVMLGGFPVIAVGLDGYGGARRYFWETAPDLEWAKRRVHHNPNKQSQLRHILDFCQDANVVTFSGPMHEYWKGGKPFVPPAHKSASERGDLYSLLQPIFLHHQDLVQRGPVLLTRQEAKPHLHMKHITKMETC